MWQSSTGRCAGRGGIGIGKMGSQKKRKSLCWRADFHQAGRSDSQANEQIRLYPVHKRKTIQARERSIAVNYRYDWWPYMQAIIKWYPDRQMIFDSLGKIQQREVMAVSEAIKRTADMEDGMERLRLVKAVYWAKHRKTMSGIALDLFISRATAFRWNLEFVLTVAECFGLYIRK